MGIKGSVKRGQDGHFIHANCDTDIIVAEEPPLGSTAKPEELYQVIERFCNGRRCVLDQETCRSGYLLISVGMKPGKTFALASCIIHAGGWSCLERSTIYVQAGSRSADPSTLHTSARLSTLPTSRTLMVPPILRTACLAARCHSGRPIFCPRMMRLRTCGQRVLRMDANKACNFQV